MVFPWFLYVYQRVMGVSPQIILPTPAYAMSSRPWSPVGSWWPNAARSQPGGRGGSAAAAAGGLHHWETMGKMAREPGKSWWNLGIELPKW